MIPFQAVEEHPAASAAWIKPLYNREGYGESGDVPGNASRTDCYSPSFCGQSKTLVAS